MLPRINSYLSSNVHSTWEQFPSKTGKPGHERSSQVLQFLGIRTGSRRGCVHAGRKITSDGCQGRRWRPRRSPTPSRTGIRGVLLGHVSRSLGERHGRLRPNEISSHARSPFNDCRARLQLFSSKHVINVWCGSKEHFRIGMPRAVEYLFDWPFLD